jgi:protein ImuA
LVIADGSGFDMTATRRIQLVAKAHHTLALLARPPWEVRQLSAAQTRWLVRWEASAEPVEDESPLLNPRWSVELLRCKGGQPECRPRVWAVEWDRGQGALRLLTPLAGATGDAGASTNDRRLKQA